jgi:hypothetical protein
MLKFALFAMKILISITYVLHLVVTLTTPNVYWCTQFLQENLRLLIVKRSFMKVGVFNLDCPKIWLTLQRWRVQEMTWGAFN